jgi:hypothetical protein
VHEYPRPPAIAAKTFAAEFRAAMLFEQVVLSVRNGIGGRTLATAD